MKVSYDTKKKKNGEMKVGRIMGKYFKKISSSEG